MAYNRNVKIGHFNRLRSPSGAQKDLQLLKKKNPSHPRLARYARNPERYADNILYDLLDCCTAEEIIKNRCGEKTTETPSQDPGQEAQDNTVEEPKDLADSKNLDDQPPKQAAEVPAEEGAAGEDAKKK